MRVTVLTPGLSVGGTERAALVLSEYLACHFDLKLLVLEEKKRTSFNLPANVDAKILNCQARHLFMGRSWADIRRSDVVVCLGLHISAAIVLRRTVYKSNFRVIGSLRGSLSALRFRKLGNLGTLWWWLQLWSLKRADAVVIPTEAGREEFSAVLKMGADRCVAIPNAVTGQKCKNVSQIVRLRTLDSGTAKRILFVGRLSFLKGVDVLVDAIYQLQKVRTNFVVDIIGSGEEEGRLRSKVESLGIQEFVRFCGVHLEPEREMRNADVLVVPSRSESFCNVVLEGLKARVPIVACDCEHGPREILHEGEYGLLVPVCDPISLCRGIDKALSGEVARPPFNAWKAYSIARVGELWRRLIGEVQIRD